MYYLFIKAKLNLLIQRILRKMILDRHKNVIAYIYRENLGKKSSNSFSIKRLSTYTDIKTLFL